ncbi:hypothetical protein EV646_11959 [Kribbella antiqua]|uniref:Lipoprotein n=1 Tax=Kribbella antiqua TaxID=2512217 RepID=A0A4R2I4Z6_9ACTN|nr:hypothetical protein [Kribbella antiqua]TCO39017.1 hypothetical protein EV646_11959 [Kribbella antiqua]
MIRRPLTLTVATLCAALALTACNGSPEAGRPNSTVTASSRTPTPTLSTPAATPTWTPEEQAAITAAKAQYAAARTAAGVALHDPRTASRDQLEAAGNGGAWLTSIVERIVFLRDRGLYQSGNAKIVSASTTSVDLAAEQPLVVLKSCIDGAGVMMRYRATGKPVPVVTTKDGARHTMSVRLVYATAKTGSKRWFLVEEKATGTC